jgi:beta-glucanase (GH16 family)
MVALGSLLAFSLHAQGQSRGDGKSSGWEDDFNSGRLDKRRWNISSGWAPGYRPNNHVGYYEPENMNLQNGYLVLRLWQEPGEVDGNREGAISHGAHVTTKQKYGYGTYEWRMRMSSTATSPSGEGVPVSGSVSAGFLYVNNSQTEIEFEFGGPLPETLYMVNWHNPDPSTGPFDDQVTFSTPSSFPDSTATSSLPNLSGSPAGFPSTSTMSARSFTPPTSPAPLSTS